MAATFERASEPRRQRCQGCGQDVLVVEYGANIVIAEPREWTPLAPCFACASVLARGNKRGGCFHCDGSHMVGKPRPTDRMLAINVAASKTYSVRFLEPSAELQRGEAGYELHECSSARAA